jgi:hypothetical protein
MAGALTKPTSKSKAEDKIKLPLAAWIAIGGAGLFFAYKAYQAKKAQSAASVATTTTAAPPTNAATSASTSPNSIVPIQTAINNLGPMEQQQYQATLAAINGVPAQTATLTAPQQTYTPPSLTGSPTAPPYGDAASQNTAWSTSPNSKDAAQGIAIKQASSAPAFPGGPAGNDMNVVGSAGPGWDWYTVQPGDVAAGLAGIANRDATNAAALWTWNSNPQNRTQASIAALEQAGAPDQIRAGEAFAVPANKAGYQQVWN